MRRSRAGEQIAQRADHYETNAGRNLRLRAEARAIAGADRAVETDGGTVADSTGDESAAPTYTHHVEPPAQGGEAYVRCTHCGRELLLDLGGKDKLPHAPNCPEREER